jgi:dTDP-4-amino-4,6-dideoxygalactose transaminase/predicted dehydrogenase
MIKVGLIGAGVIAHEHARAIASALGPGALIAVADTHAERLEAFASAFGVGRRYADVESLIGDPQIDLVVVATPPSSHESVVVSALDRGKHVLCEKPLAHSLASAARILEAEARNPGRLSVSHQLRYEPGFQRLRWLIREGWIGDLETAQLERHGAIPHADPGKAGWWGAWDVAGGGVLITQLIHELDLLLAVMGPVCSVRAIMDTRYTSIESEDHVEATLRFRSGASARCAGSVNSGRFENGLAIRGAKGIAGLPASFATEDPRGRSAALRAVDAALPDARPARSSFSARAVGKLLRRPAAPELSPHARLYLDIASRMSRGEALPIPGSDAWPALELCMAIYEAAVTGSEVELPLGPGAKVYNGVTRQIYSGRVGGGKVGDASRDLIGEAAVHAVAPPVNSLERATLKAVKRCLAQLGVGPAHVKALLRRPARVHGGPQVRRWPWPRRRMFDRRERRAVLEVLDRELRQGGAVAYGGVEEEAYCAAFARFLGGGYADAVNSGTNALYVALRTLELEPGTEVIVPPATDAGGTMPVAMLNCIPVPADSEPGSVLTSADQIREVMTDRTAAIVVAHIAGHPVDLDPILALAEARGIPVIEDCAQAHGTLYKGRMVGTFGTVAAFSTMFGKHHATGAQGGVVFSRDRRLITRARQIADRGKPYGARGAPGNLYASLNMNQDELSMAIGRVQLAKLPGFVAARRRFAAWIEEGLEAVEGVELIGDPPHGESSYLFLMLRFDPLALRCTSQQFAEALIAEGIEGASAGYGIYPTDQPWHRNAAVFGSSGMPWSLRSNEKPPIYPLPNIRRANQEIVRLEIHEGLAAREARDVVSAIDKIARHFRAQAETVAS